MRPCGRATRANGWLARAKDLLGGQPDSIEWGWVALVESEPTFDPMVALEYAERALAVARRAREPDLELAALGRAGLAGIAARSGQARAEAEAELALGSVRAAEGDAAAREHLDRSLGLFVRLRMPHAAGRAHLAEERAGTSRSTREIGKR